MRVSKKSEYAIRALVEIALRQGDGNGWRQISQIADTTRIPEKFLEQILLTLKKRGLLQSRRGVVGGYALHAEPDSINMDMVIQILDGDSTDEKTTSDAGTAVYHRILARSEHAAREVLRGTTLADLVREARKLQGLGASTLDYHI